jgi:hypothetical protein
MISLIGKNATCLTSQETGCGLLAALCRSGFPAAKHPLPGDRGSKAAPPKNINALRCHPDGYAGSPFPAQNR